MKEGGTKFFHALVYYGQKRESVLTLKPFFIRKTAACRKRDKEGRLPEGSLLPHQPRDG